MSPAEDARASEALRALRKIAAGGTVRASHVRSRHRALYRRLIRSFRTFEEARRRAGLAPPPPTRSWSLRRVIVELRRLHRAGTRITMPYLKAAGRDDLAAAVERYAGGIKAARRLAGIPEPRAPRRGEQEPWDAARVIGEIQALHAAGRSIAFSKVEGKLRMAAKRHCGSYRAAVEAAGFDYDATRLMSAPLERDHVIEALRALRRARPSLTRGELGRHKLARTIGRLFGSIDEVLDAAGITDWPHVRRRGGILDRAAVIRGVQNRHRAGKSLIYGAVARDDYRLYRSATWHFGQWPLALAAARVPLRRQAWSRDAIIQALRARYRRGKLIAPAALRREANPLLLAAERHFGSLWSAATAAGLPTRGGSKPASASRSGRRSRRRAKGASR